MYSNEKRNSLHMQLWTLEKRVKLSYWITFLILFSYVCKHTDGSILFPLRYRLSNFSFFIHIMHIHSTQLLWTIWIEMNAKYDVCFLWKFYSISKRKNYEMSLEKNPITLMIHSYMQYVFFNQCLILFRFLET